MVFTAAQSTAFFEDAAQMGIPHDTVIQLQTEGLMSPNDLSEFDDDAIVQIALNLRRPTGRIPDPNPGAPAGATIAQPPFVFGAKSQQRLKAAAELTRYYETVGRVLTPAVMRWTSVVSNFKDGWKALEARHTEDPPELPKVTRALPIVRWTETMKDFLHRVLGCRKIPLGYVIRATVVPPQIGVPVLNQPYSVGFDSIESELERPRLLPH
jgi:hypothetical protein